MSLQLRHADETTTDAGAASLRRLRFAVYGAAGLAILLACAGIGLWMRYGVATFFDILAAGIATCF
ncbi:hypothetical protein ACLBXM_11260 [Xanthobacteraceae bacterium A53D]